MPLACDARLLLLCLSLQAALALCLESVPLAQAASPSEPEVTGEQVQATVTRAAAVLKRKWSRAHSGNVGEMAIAATALLNAGIPPDDTTVSSLIRRVVSSSRGERAYGYAGAYVCGAVNILLGQLQNPKYQRLAEQNTSALLEMQHPTGGWGEGSFIDYSRTQFALLGLQGARELGIDVPEQTLERARRYLASGQNHDGSWGYQPQQPGYGSMTAAGISSLYIALGDKLRQTPTCGQPLSNAALRQGLDWLGDHFTVRNNPKRGGRHYYYLYALERVGVLTGEKYIGGHDWYREGAAFLVKTQLSDGTWPSESSEMGSEFALLFLAKASAPLALQKLEYGAGWNPDPYDTRDLVAQASRELRMRLACQSVGAEASVKQLALAPLLYLQGHDVLDFPPALRESLKGYIAQGGFVFASACCGSPKFAESFRSEMTRIFPDSTFDTLTPDHEIYSARHKLEAKACRIEGLSSGCRTAVFLSTRDLCCAWGGCKGCLSGQALEQRSALKLGINLISYTLSFNGLRDKLSGALLSSVKKSDAPPATRGSLLIGQLRHDGDWNPDPAALTHLSTSIRQHFKLSSDVGCRVVTPGLDDLGDYPVLFLTGHARFSFNDKQLAALHKYLDGGGFIFAEACCGKAEFDAAFRKLCERLRGDAPLKKVPDKHMLLSEPYALDRVEYRPAAKALIPNLKNKPHLEAIAGADGRLQIVYSPFSLGCGLQGHPCARCLGVASPDAFRIAGNILSYALAH